MFLEQIVSDQPFDLFVVQSSLRWALRVWTRDIVRPRCYFEFDIGSHTLKAQKY